MIEGITALCKLKAIYIKTQKFPMLCMNVYKFLILSHMHQLLVHASKELMFKWNFIFKAD